jgi:hypothetical protein
VWGDVCYSVRWMVCAGVRLWLVGAGVRVMVGADEWWLRWWVLTYPVPVSTYPVLVLVLVPVPAPALAITLISYHRFT